MSSSTIIVIVWIVIGFLISGHLFSGRVEARENFHHHRYPHRRHEHFYITSKESENRESDSIALDDLIYSIERGDGDSTIPKLQPVIHQPTISRIAAPTDLPGSRRGVMIGDHDEQISRGAAVVMQNFVPDFHIRPAVRPSVRRTDPPCPPPRGGSTATTATAAAVAAAAATSR
ncbi:hypothetical protein RB195_013222 [Necator americanus]|uniref:Secreted protein n=1 Tax=Necator americanus TaxID=51031 RepID=A0ABR1DUH1_NECAM